MTRWRVDSDIAQLALSTTRRRSLHLADLRRCLATLRSAGYRAAVTTALPPPDQAVFVNAGFRVVEELHLLRRLLRRGSLPGSRQAPRATRRARRRDRESILDLDRASFEPFWQMDAAMLDEALTATPASRLRIIDGPDGVVGYAVCGRSGNRGYVQRLAVHPDHQNQGLGTALLTDGLAWMTRWGARDASVNTQLGNEQSLRLYRRMGFGLQPDGLAVLRIDLSTDHPSDDRTTSGPKQA